MHLSDQLLRGPPGILRWRKLPQIEPEIYRSVRWRIACGAGVGVGFYLEIYPGFVQVYLAWQDLIVLLRSSFNVPAKSSVTFPHYRTFDIKDLFQIAEVRNPAPRY